MHLIKNFTFDSLYNFTWEHLRKEKDLSPSFLFSTYFLYKKFKEKRKRKKCEHNFDSNAHAFNNIKKKEKKIFNILCLMIIPTLALTPVPVVVNFSFTMYACLWNPRIIFFVNKMTGSWKNKLRWWRWRPEILYASNAQAFQF